MKAFNNFGIECYKDGELDHTHYTKTITEAIEYAKERQEIGLYKTRIITANEYGIRLDYIDDPDFQEAEHRANYKKELAQRLFDLIDPWEREDDTLEQITRTLKNDPLAIIEDLLTRIEDLEA